MPTGLVGPSLHEYVETRLNLLTKTIEKLDETVEDKLEARSEAARLFAKTMEDRFTHANKLNELTQDSAKRAVDKAEAAQAAHNVATNEWRGTLNDFKSTLVSKSEFDRLSSDFAAYRLEASRLFAAAQGEKSSGKEHKDDNRVWIAIGISVATALYQLFAHKLT